MIIEACLKFNGKTDEGTITLLSRKRDVIKNYIRNMAVKPDLEGCLGVLQ